MDEKGFRRISCSNDSTIFDRALYRQAASNNEDNLPSYILDKTSALEDSRKASKDNRPEDRVSSSSIQSPAPLALAISLQII